MPAFRTRLLIKDKRTQRTYVKHGSFCVTTGTRRLVTSWRGGWAEYNDRGEPVLDSWVIPNPYIKIETRCALE